MIQIEKRFLTVREVAGALGCPLPQVYWYISKGRIPWARHGARKIVIPVDAFNQFVAEKTAEAMANMQVEEGQNAA